MKKLFIVFVIAFSSNISGAQSMDEIAIRKVLDNQVTAWNGGNIDKFMNTYWRNDSLMFIGKSGVTYGWQPTLENYKKHYPDTASMGQLTFNLLELKPLSTAVYLVVGKWHLQRTIGNIEGYFTLLLRKINGQWLIVADHSS